MYLYYFAVKVEACWLFFSVLLYDIIVKFLWRSRPDSVFFCLQFDAEVIRPSSFPLVCFSRGKVFVCFSVFPSGFVSDVNPDFSSVSRRFKQNKLKFLLRQVKGFFLLQQTAEIKLCLIQIHWGFKWRKLEIKFQFHELKTEFSDFRARKTSKIRNALTNMEPSYLEETSKNDVVFLLFL